MLSLKYYNNHKEFTEAMNLYYSKTQKRKFDMVLGLVLSLISIPLFFLIEHSNTFIFLFCVSLFLFLFSLFKGSIYSKVRFLKDKKFNEEYEVNFSDQGIQFKTVSINSEIKWNFYSKVWETQKFFFLFYGKDLFSLFPKRAFQNNESVMEFRELIKRKINDYRSL